MSFWTRFLPWSKPEPAPFVPVYPVLCSGAEKVASPAFVYPARATRHVAPKPAQKISNRTKPFNKPRAARMIATGVVREIREYVGAEAFTIFEINEWIGSYCQQRNIDMGGLTLVAIRTEMKGCSGVRFEYRRLKDNPDYAFLRRRHAARKIPLKERAWIFIIDETPDHVEAEAQLNRRAA